VVQLSGNSDILSDLGQFLRNLFQDITSGLLFFGGPLDVVIAVGDILATTLIVYYILKLLRDSRAWQLLKGLILILAFAVIGSLAGLNTVGFLLNNTISVLAIAFVVIFQPELRRALETVGRNSFNVLSSAITQEEKVKNVGSVHNIIEAIVRACEKMAQTRTGALIILERQTRLGELAAQENVVKLDAAVSATMLMQIFYKGSPLHDGAVLIREGRLAAARVHVPLSDNYHLRRDYGTRHRAAIGASEMGDTIAVVVSEERGTISVALDGRLYTLDNGDALRALLHKLLGVSRSTVSFVGQWFRGGKKQKETSEVNHETAPELEDESIGAPRKALPVKSNRKSRVLLILSSLAISVVLWLYVQVTINPIETRTFTVPLTYEGIEEAESRGLEFQYPLQNIQVTLMGRRKTINTLNSDQVIAYLDFSTVESTGLVRLDVQVDTGGLMYLRTTYKSPSAVTVNVWEKDEDP
jgi:diadenylate cyclase